MNGYMIFIIPTIIGTILGLDGYRILFRSASDAASRYERLARAIGGSFAGAFGGVLLATAFPALATWPQNYATAIVVATAVSIAVQMPFYTKGT